jgi:hypothetical protein
MARTPEQMVALASRTFELRKADWRSKGMFHLNVPKDTVEGRFAVLRGAMEWRNWMQAYSAVCDLVAIWQAEDDWESTVRAQVDPEGHFPEELFGRPAGSITSLEHNIVASLDSSNSQSPAQWGPVELDADSASPASSTAIETIRLNWDQVGGSWRHASKVPSHPSRPRGVIVQRGTRKHWFYCDAQLTQQILNFYDNAAPMETLQNVEGLLGRTCGIRFEGGMYLTLRDTLGRIIRVLNVVYRS